MCEKEEKVYLTWTEQVDKLKKRNMAFTSKENEKNAAYILQNNSYYALVNGYKDILGVISVNEEDNYNGALFDDLKEAYDFDKNISSILFKYLLRIEDSIKAIFSHYIAKTYGHKNYDYLTHYNYRKGKQLRDSQKFERDKLLEKLNKPIEINRDLQIIHYNEDYGYVPPWVLVSCISLDVLNFWFKLSNRKIKKDVVKTILYDYEQYPFVSITDLEENIELFSEGFKLIKEYRNRAAHGNRIINHTSKHNLNINSILKYVPNREEIISLYDTGGLRGDIMSVFVLVLIMLSKRSTLSTSFINELEAEFDKLNNTNPNLYKKILKQTKIPDNFLDILRNITYI
ncbi:Abi family protein [Vagococcus lutrae]|uniref:Abi family protein n=1 Tax=Vagococcus lutrae TaxID=81947 RepID=UPI002097D59E|nr:Abi family protein [Vagococcus lutrae]MCO7151877.1 Abi family protein [Vagococcus lutrae]MDT2813136.1 Abi family protein [Vagococcus lutrae]